MPALMKLPTLSTSSSTATKLSAALALAMDHQFPVGTELCDQVLPESVEV